MLPIPDGLGLASSARWRHHANEPRPSSIVALMNASAVIRLMRPRQWTKNLAVFAALLFSHNILNAGMLARVCLGFIALCFSASALYAANDAVDAERDRQHPSKRTRPVTAGDISVTQAWMIAVVLLAAGLALSWSLGIGFFTAVAGYVVLQGLYTAGLKNVAIVDMLVIAAGFVIRATAGALVIGVRVSPWLVLCAGLLALFLAAAKRRHELKLLRGHSHEHRPVLGEYSAELLDSFMVTLSAATITSYALYTFFEAAAPDYLMMLTIPFVIYGILRYQLLVLIRSGGGQPEEILLGDAPILACIALWATSSMAVLYLGPLL